MSARRTGTGAIVEARFAGDCWNCFGGIKIGELIHLVDERWEHVHCPDDAEPTAPLDAGSVCGTCFQAYARNGSCACG